METIKPSLINLFLSFLKLGLTAFGGPAIVAHIKKMAVENRKWMDEETFSDGVALCQTIPGATSMQASAYVGLRTRGLEGAIVSFVGFGFPSFLLMLLLSALYKKTYTLPFIVSIFKGLQVIVVAIVANATLFFARSSLKRWKDLIIIILSSGMFWFRVNPIIVIILSSLFGILLYKNQKIEKIQVIEKRKLYSKKSFLLLLISALLGFLALFFIDKRLFELAFLMLRIDLFAFGGGFASVPFMFHEVVDVRHWIDSRDFLNGIALGQITPGPVVITATFVGYLLFGPIGGVIATICVFLPSFFILIITVPYFDRIRRSPYFIKAISGIFSSFVGLLLSVTFKFGLNVHWGIHSFSIALLAFISLFFGVDILWVVLGGALLSAFIL
jgi:chromate transporter